MKEVCVTEIVTLCDIAILLVPTPQPSRPLSRSCSQCSTKATTKIVDCVCKLAFEQRIYGKGNNLF